MSQQHPQEGTGELGFVLVDDCGRCTALNGAAAALFEVQTNEAKGKSFADLLPSAVDSGARDRWLRATREGVRADLGEYRAADGRRFVGDCTPLAGGSLLRLCSAVAHGRALQPRTDERSKVEKVIGELGHELRGPLSAVFSSATLLRRTMSEGERKNVLDRLDRQALLCLRLVENLLDVGHVMSGRSPLRVERTDLGELVMDAVDIVRDRAERKNHRIDVTVPAGGFVEVDRPRLQQALLNLLANAISYTDPGGTITVAADIAGRDVRIRVRDSGRGIALEHLPHLFERSFAIPTGDTGELHLGVGLRVVRRIVELHGGTVSAASAGVGRGSEFCIDLPDRVARFGGLPVARDGTRNPSGAESAVRNLPSGH